MAGNTARFHDVAIGLKCVYASLLLLVLTIFGGAIWGGVMGVQAAQQGRKFDPTDLGALVLVGAGLGLLSTGLSIFGQIKCLNVPEKVQATKTIYAAVVLAAVALVVNLGAQFKVLPANVANFGGLLSTAGWICFLVFLRRLARFLHNEKQVSRANFVLYGSVFTWVTLIVLMIGMLTMVGPGGAAPGNPGPVAVMSLGMFGAAIFALVLFVSYSNLIRGLRLDIEDRLSGRDMAA